MSGLCAVCRDGCQGGCEMFLASFRGREVIYPGPSAHHRRRGQGLPGRLLAPEHPGLRPGRRGPARRRRARPGHRALPRRSNTETEYGWTKKVKMRLPIFTGALGSTEIARKNWEHFAVGAAISGITLVCGENVCGIDPELELDSNGKVKSSPEMDRRIETYQALPRGLRRDPRADERRGHAPRRGRVRARQARPRHDRAEVGPGRQVHRRRDQGRLPGARPGAARGAATSSLPTRPTRAIQAAFKDGAIKEFERHSPARLRRPRRASSTKSSGCASSAPSASRSRPAPTRCASWPWPSVGRRGQDRPADHRRRPRRHRHEPLADDEGVGHPDVLPAVAGRTSSAAKLREARHPRARHRHRRRLLAPKTTSSRPWPWARRTSRRSAWAAR